MIFGCAKYITTWLIKHDAVQWEDRELYEYAVYSLILTASPLVLVLVIGGIMGMVKESILLILPFMVIRKFSGGYHAKHDWTCLLGSCGVLFLCVYIVSYITCNIKLIIVTLSTVISLNILSPIDSENRRLTEHEKKRYKAVVCISAGLFFILFVALMVLGADVYAACFAVGLILSASLQFPCVFLLLKEKCSKRRTLLWNFDQKERKNVVSR